MYQSGLKRLLLLGSVFCISSLRTGTARAQEKNNMQLDDTILFQEEFRPQYHLTPIMGWVNDPTALVYVNGYYQVNKRLAISKDLIHWLREEHPHNFNRKDSVGEMSGSAVLDINNTSGFGLNGKPPLVSIWSGLRFRDIMQFQCISYSNDEGRTWIKYNKNPVIDIGSTEFRDPQVFWFEKEKKWIMVVALAAERKARFYSSSNLKDWIFLSDFGPAGAENGVWECPDFFVLPVDGSMQNMKWVLEVSVQPTGGQYFIGSFDGTTFTADAEFVNKSVRTNDSEGTVLFDFEKDLSDWTKEGTAFSGSPYAGSMPMQGAVLGYVGEKLVNSFYHGDSSVGKISSPSFSLDKHYLNILIGGGDHPGTIEVNLIVDNKAIKTASGPNTEVLKWTSWDVSAWKGKRAKIEIIDAEKGGFGHITVDQIVLSNHPAKDEVPKAFWMDYGPDYYAVRSWVNGPSGDNRRVSSAWMSNWLYASEVPTKPWKGIHTFPRSVTLKTFPEGVRLIQQPIAEIKTLHGKHFHAVNITVNENYDPIAFTPVKNSYEMVAEIDPGKSREFGLNLCVGKNEKTILNYNVTTQTLSINRMNSGNVSFSKSFPGTYAAPLRLNRNGKIFLHILVDQCSIEVFGNDGEATITCQVFPDAKSVGIEIYSKGGKAKLEKLDAWEMLPFWIGKKDDKAKNDL